MQLLDTLQFSTLGWLPHVSVIMLQQEVALNVVGLPSHRFPKQLMAPHPPESATGGHEAVFLAHLPLYMYVLTRLL